MAKCENKRFGVKIFPAKSPLEEEKLSLRWRFDFDGERYGDYLLFACNENFEVCADEFVEGVELLRNQMEQAAEMLENKKTEESV